jgi:hypothetical protein
MSGVDVSTPALAHQALTEDASLSPEKAAVLGNRKQAQVSDFLRQYVRPGAEVDLYVHRDPAMLMQRMDDGRPSVPAVISAGGVNVNRELVRRGLAERAEAEGVLDDMSGVSATHWAFGSMWERLLHGMETPLESFTPLAPTAKFIHQRTPLEDYLRSEIYGRDVALWEKPVSHFLAPGLKTTAWWMGWRGIPSEVKERWMVQEYFDRLEYMKQSRLQEVALSEGRGRDAATAASRARATATGANPYSYMQSYMATDRPEKEYFKEFVEAPTAAERRQIERYVSPQTRELLQAQWTRRAAESARMRMEAGIPGEGDVRLARQYEAQQAEALEERARAAEVAASQMPVPRPDWVGWDESVPLEDVQVETVLDKNMDLTAFGFWPSDIRRIERKPYIAPVNVDYGPSARSIPSLTAVRRLYNRIMGKAGHRPPQTSAAPTNRSVVRVNSPGYDRVDRYLRDPSIMEF